MGPCKVLSVHEKKEKKEKGGKKKKTFPTHTSTTAATHPLGYGAGKAALCHLLRHTLPLGVSQDDCFWGDYITGLGKLFVGLLG